MTIAAGLFQRNILVVEDDYLIATDLCLHMQEAGANVIGPAATLEHAMELLDDDATVIHAATLDIDMRGNVSYPLADTLTARAIPFVFVSAYHPATLPPRFEHAPFCEKPVRLTTIVGRLCEELALS